MSEIVVVGSFTAREGMEDEAAAAMRDLMPPTHDEDGCILYALHRGSDDPARLAFVERWTSRDHLDAHLATDHVKALLGRQEELFAAGDITVYEAVPGGQDHKGSIAAHAGG